MGIMQRGDLVTVSLHGDYGKPRPAVIVQSNLLNEYGAQYWIRTSDLRLRRPTLYPAELTARAADYRELAGALSNLSCATP